jgi:hypothetical protein
LNNEQDVEDDEDKDEEEKRMRLFPSELRYWVPEADSLARERKTMKSYQTSNSWKVKKFIRAGTLQGFSS